MKPKHIVLIAFAVLALFVANYFVSTYNFGVRSDIGVKAAHENLENILGQYTLKAKESMKVSDKYADALTEYVRSAMTGQFGENGSQAQWQWMQQNLPQLDASMYKQVQQIIEAGRTKFENAQTEFIDRKRAYETVLGEFPKGPVLGWLGFPKVPLDNYKTVTSSHAKKSFETGIDDGLEL